MGNSSSFPSQDNRCRCHENVTEDDHQVEDTTRRNICKTFAELPIELKDEVLKQCTIKELAMIKQCNRQMMRLVKASIRASKHVTITLKANHYPDQKQLVAILDASIGRNMTKISFVNESGHLYWFVIDGKSIDKV